jgi:hypothetical protein
MSTIEIDPDRNFEEQRHRDKLRGLEDREPQTIEGEIDATRADMRATIEALERRLSFDRLADIAVSRIRESAGDLARNLTDATARNFVPLLLTSAGLMMLAKRRRTRAQHYDSYSASRGYNDRMSNVRERASHAADKAYGAVSSTRETLKHAAESSRDALRTASQSSRDTLEHTAESLREGASRAASIAREQVESARGSVDRIVHEQPLMLGALGLAAGAIIGAMLPMTEHEDRLLGEVRDKAVKNVADKGRALYETARETARETVREHAAPYSAQDAQDRDRAEDGAPGSQQAPRPH